MLKQAIRHLELAIQVTENAIQARFDLDHLLEMVNQGVPRQIFFSELKNSIRKEMLNAAVNGYSVLGGAHSPFNADILNKAIDSQLFYANRYEQSGDKLESNRIGMYAEEAEHIGSVVGAQQYFKEYGAKQWQRRLHPELSKTGPCPQCTADAELAHSIDTPFFEFHPQGVCTAQGIAFQSDSGNIEIPVPGHNPHTFLDKIKELLGNVTSIIRRFRR